jgi:3-deoxy-manno-octulosonate cytidylyltransferase (CMP-KDO synthetase)
MRAIGVIPARYASTRLKAKVLVDLLGKPLIQHVWERAIQAKHLSELFVATDDVRIKDVCASFGAKVLMTSPDCASGSDRIIEAAKDINAAYILNIQGDEPLIDPDIIDGLIAVLRKEKQAPVATVIKRIEKQEEVSNPNVVKVVIDKKGYALYFSRSTIPFNRDAATGNEPVYYKHLGIYGYHKSFLMNFNKLPKSLLEQAEKLEQLRILEAGYKIKVIETDKETISVDTAEDLEKVKLVLGKMKK